ncbi:MAG: tryptophan 7-halogenase [Gammaproteobacteria bacterium]|nr:tryptophan 7-halogenase [Gammaproteobacteria bacterium]MDH5320952.1 tryptophan 7-halogenase [Gammaproteobacteria bacterium]
MQDKIRVVVAGGGTAGWLTAYSLVKRLGNLLDITLVESDQIGTVGVGESSVPTMRRFHQFFGIDEREFMRATQATFKLCIVFENWGAPGQRYAHTFGEIGQSNWLVEFHQYWLEAYANGFGGSLEDYCLELKAAKAGKFAVKAGETPLKYAFHLDATAYAGFLRQKSESLGVRRVEGKISEVIVDSVTGNIQSLELEQDRQVAGDFFVDCTGFKSLLLGSALHVEFEDWSHWLAADRALAVQTTSTEPPLPYTRAIAHSSGWQWRIPLQSRTGNGLVYSSGFCSDDDARVTLLGNITGQSITEPRLLKFKTGRRKNAWQKNCVAIGLSAGFIEPLESTSIHLIDTAVVRLMRLFPFSGAMAPLAEQFNRETLVEWEAVRDFIILHYKLTQRDDSEFWNYYRTMDIPDSLAHRMEIFREHGFAWPDSVSFFPAHSWVQVMFGQGLFPEHRHGASRILPPEALKLELEKLSAFVNHNLAKLPDHNDFLRQYLALPGFHAHQDSAT